MIISPRRLSGSLLVVVLLVLALTIEDVHARRRLTTGSRNRGRTRPYPKNTICSTPVRKPRPSPRPRPRRLPSSNPTFKPGTQSQIRPTARPRPSSSQPTFNPILLSYTGPQNQTRPTAQPRPRSLPSGNPTFKPTLPSYPAGGYESSDDYQPIMDTNAHKVQSSYPQAPQKSSSGLGLVTVINSTALDVLGHARTLMKILSSGGGGGGGGGGGDDKIIIVNNGPPGSVTTSDVGSGTTVINTGGTQAAANPSLPVPPVYAAPPAPGVQALPVPPVPGAVAPETPVAPETLIDPGTSVTPKTPIAPAVPNPADPNAPPTGQLICVPLKVPQPDPKNPTKTIEVACYPATPPETAPPANGTAPAEWPVPAPISGPGAVSQPDVMKMPGPTQASLSADAHNVAAPTFLHFSLISTVVTLIVTFCLHRTPTSSQSLSQSSPMTTRKL